jgi:TonB-linked SusC/RagA family outer membrane protein
MKQKQLLKKLFILIAFLSLKTMSYAMVEQKVTGTIIGADDKKPIIGANIQLKSSTKIGTQSDALGEFTLNVPDGEQTLVISYIGYETKEVKVTGNGQKISVILEVGAKKLSEVVVTALGIQKSSKSLAYAVTEVKGAEFTTAKESNLANALVGKIAGVNATSMGTGPAGSSRVVIRGNGSLNGNNQPLYVINDMPMDNTMLGLPKKDGFPTDPIANGLNIDKGDGISGINPDDIESISVLKGGTAAALYGSLASNGVIIIKTKRGTARKGVGVDINSSFTTETPLVFTDWQYDYGVGVGGKKPLTQSDAINYGRLSYGAKIDGTDVIQFDGVSRPYSAQKNNIKNFFNTGSTFTNTVALSGGNEKFSTRFSVSNMNNKGIIPNSTYDRTTFNMATNFSLSKHINFDVVSQYNIENAENRPVVSDAFGNPNWGLYMIGNTVDIRSLSATDANGVEQAWNSVPIASNPWYVVNNFKKTDTRNRFINSATVTFDITDNLFLKGRVGRDYNNFKYVGIVPSNTLYTPLGGYQLQNSNYSTSNMELIGGYKNGNLFKNIGFSGIIGVSKRQSVRDEYIAQGKDFIIPNFYSITNLGTVSQSFPYGKVVTSSAFSSLDFDYKNLVFLTVTGRQDWFSTLSLANNKIFYPSVGTGFIISDMMKLPKAVQYLKLRASWAQVGGATPSPYALDPSYSLAQSGHLGQALQQVSSTRVPNPNLKPLTSTTFEVGIEGYLFKNRGISFDIAFYNRKTTNDIVETTVSAASAYRTALLNVGQISNKGIEALIGAKILTHSKIKWNTSFNMAYNKNTVDKISDNLTNIVMASSVNGYAYIYSQTGRPYSVIMGRDYKRDANGSIIYNVANGVAIPVAGDLKELGQGVHPFTAGFNNDFEYKNFKLGILIDGKFGGSIYSGTNLYATRFGLNKITLPGRENGLPIKGVDTKGNAIDMINPVANLNSYYDSFKNISSLFIYDDSFVKLRQVTFGYVIPIAKNGIFSKLNNVTISFVARNLFTLYSKTPNIDPESIISADNAQGIEQFGVPRTRSYGLNLKLSL